MSPRQWRLSVVGALALALVATGCTTGKNGASGPAVTTTVTVSQTPTESAAPSTSSTPTPPAPAAALSFLPAAGAKDVNPAGAVKVASIGGTIASVVMTNPDGDTIGGALTADRTTWQAAEDLGYGKTYQLQATAVNADGVKVKKTASFTTVQPDNLTMPYFDTTGGGAMVDGATYGVGMVTNVHFDEAITDKKAAEKALVVKTTPAVTGAWYWLDDQNVHWRPKTYFKTGTKVTITAKVYGVNVGNDLYGQADKSISFKIGAKHVSVSDDKTKQVQVFINDKLARTMPTSMGKGGTQAVNGRTISYWTQPGIYTVLDKSNPVLMDSSTYGLPQDKGGYKEYINWATRISTDGVYLHELDTTVWAQGNTDTSHGCLNLNQVNAQWFYGIAQVGDVVKVINTGGAPLAAWQNGDWSVPWSEWVAGGDVS